ncbi:MAG: acyl-CoA dehydrogenase [Rickettsiales bacterium]|nr:acyl-CoA dehydrogenase [Rickettsiales bacterium]
MSDFTILITSIPTCYLLMFGGFLFTIMLYNGAYFWLYSLVGLILLQHFSPTDLTNLIYIAANLFFLIRPIRRAFVTSPFLAAMKYLNMVPRISETEKTALRSGSTWIDEDIFSGKPNLDYILKEPFNNLSETEQNFIDNQVNELCKITDDWKVNTERDLPKPVWTYLKKQKFFGMIIPKKYGGLGFSALGQSSVIAKLATRSQTLAITVMVPNSLGPAELLIRYGTKKQKEYFLPRLADGREIPCFGLTEPSAGSDATAIKANGEVFKDKKGNIKIRLNFKKRYITLGNVATVIGLAFYIKDPENLLGKGTKPEITLALLKRKTEGLKIDRRHDPLNVPFVNSPINGENVIISPDDIIGGIDGYGNGWKMLMECLAIGRGISLPATSLGGAQLVSKVVGNYSLIREQFGIAIGKFEGIQEVVASIAAKTYMLESARIFIASSIDSGHKPSVINAIAKYHFTENFREIINDGMDVLGGSAICRGPRNLLASPYAGVPIGITVEGANIMTRSLIIFGQGAIRCHKYSYDEVIAIENKDFAKFDFILFKHIKHFLRNKVRSILLSLTRGHLAYPLRFGLIGSSKRKILWASSSFAYLSDLALARFGGNMKRKEMLSARFGDILSNIFFAIALIRRFEAEGRPSEDKIYLSFALKQCFNKIDDGFHGIFNNFGSGPIGLILKYIVSFYARINRLSSAPSDKLKAKIAASMMKDDDRRNRLTNLVYHGDNNDIIVRLDKAFNLTLELLEVKKRVGIYRRQNGADISIEEMVKNKVLTDLEAQKYQELQTLINDLYEVDAYAVKDYLSGKMTKPII